MKTSSIFAMGNGFQVSKKEWKPRTTAYYIFDEEVVHPYMVNTTYFHERNGRLGQPIIGAANAQDVERISEEMVSTGDTIWKIVTQFIDGANIGFSDPAVCAEIYKRILNHLEGHLTAMRTDISYDAPEMDDFRHMAEFATKIRYIALKHNADLDKNVNEAGIQRIMGARPVFVAYRGQDDRRREEPKLTVPKTIKTMDAIERFLEMTNGS